MEGESGNPGPRPSFKKLIGFARRTPGNDVQLSLVEKGGAAGTTCDLECVLGRFFFFTVLPMLRPFLGPFYAWTSAVSQFHSLRLPKAIDLILVFLENLLLKGFRVARVAKHSFETAPVRTHRRVGMRTACRLSAPCHRTFVLRIHRTIQSVVLYLSRLVLQKLLNVIAFVVFLVLLYM